MLVMYASTRERAPPIDELWIFEMCTHFCTCLLKVQTIACSSMSFWSQSSDRNEDMMRYRHVYAKSLK